MSNVPALFTTLPSAKVAEPVMARQLKVAEPHQLYEQTKNYGADINTLIELLEAGKL